MVRVIYRLLIYALTAGLLAACLPAAPAAPRPVETGAATAEQNQSAPDDSIVTPVQETGMAPSSIPTGTAQQKMVDLAVAQLAKETGLDPARITVVEVKAVIWRDASLGCPKPGIDYIQVETPGFNIQLKAGEQVYSYHANETGRVIRCER